MLRQIIKIDEEKCNGCGLCVTACHEGAIKLVDGKARLIRDDYCDGLGDCLPGCPVGAITFEQREAAEYNAEEVKKNMEQKRQELNAHHGSNGSPCGCPGTQAKAIARRVTEEEPVIQEQPQIVASQLNSWPIQIKLVPVQAPYFDGAHLLIAADCTAYAYGNFHQDLMKNKITLIGCPKLDEGDYSEKLAAIIKNNNLKSVTVVRMEVPCCAGLANAAVEALKASGKMLPWRIVTISIDGQILED